MPAYRCSNCDANWARLDSNKRCPACGNLTWDVTENPDKTFDEARQAREQRTAAPTVEIVLPRDYLHAHRVERFGSLGFSEENAELLAATKDKLGFPLYWGDIATALKAGCTHEQAVVIYT